MSDCIKNLTKEEIIMEFGKDEIMKSCNKCNNLIYSSGIMTCKLINESEEGEK